MFGDISGHGDVKITIVAVPVECDPTVEIDCVIYFDIVMAFDCCDEMIEMLFSDVFNSKIVHDEGELDGAGDMLEESWHVREFKVAVSGESFFK